MMLIRGGEGMKYLATLKKLIHDDSGQDLIEYALVAALIALASVAAMKTLSGKIATEFTNVGNSLT
jgi:pilus assembly protein Flp/PilA